MRVKKTLLLIALLVLISTQFLSIVKINAAIPPIGTTVQSNPFESNPTGDNNNIVSLPPGPNSLPKIRDGDLGNYESWSIGASTNGYVNATGFESAPTSFTIGWVDIKIKYSAEATSNDQYRIFYQLTGSPIVKTLQGYVSGASAKFDYTGQADERVWSKVAEPGGPGLDGVWSWTDIGNLKVVVQTQQQGGVDDGNLFYLYEVWLTIYEGPYPQGLSARGPNDKYYDAGGTVNYWDVGEPAIRDVNNDGFYDSGDVVLAGTAPSLGVALKIPTALNKYLDLNVNGVWDVGESAIRDVNNNGIYDTGDVVLAGTAPAPPSTVSIQPPLVLGLGADSKFFVDVFVTNVANMHGFQFKIDFDERILTATDYFAYNPFILQAPSELTVSGTYLYVNKTGGFTNRIKEWSVQGTSSYLYEEDYPTNYIDTTTTDAKIGDFRFAPTRLFFETMYSKRVFLEIYANQTAGGDDQIEVWLYDESTSAFVSVGTITPDPFDPANPLPPSWKSTDDLQSILDTLDKINNAKVYLVKKTNGAADQIMVDAMRLRIPDTGYAAVAFSSYMGDPTGFTGSEPVVRIYFKVDADGASLLHFVKSLLTTTAGAAITHTRNEGVFAKEMFHDVAVTDVKVNATQVMPGGHVKVSVTVKNQGTYTETFPVTAYYDSTAIGTPQTVTDLGLGQFQVLTFDWDTSGVSVGRYLIKAEATLADQYPDNNVKEDGWVLVGRHDIAVTKVMRAYPTPDVAIPESVKYLNVTQGEKVYVNVTVYNNGTFPETFNVTTRYWSGDEPGPPTGYKTIGTNTSISLNPGINNYYDANSNNVWDVGEPAIQDVNNNGKYDNGVDVVLAGTAPPDGSSLKTPGVNDKYYDANSNNVWDVGEPAIQDVNGNGVFDTGDVVLAFSPAPPLKLPGTSDKYWDINNDDVWNVGEPAIQDVNSNNVYDDGTDVVLAGSVPPLKLPGTSDKYYDANSNNVWDVDEPAIRDVNNNGKYDDGVDVVLAGTAPSNDVALKLPGSSDKYYDANNNNVWDVDEPAIRDTNNNGIYDAADVVLAGTAPPLTLKAPGTLDKYWDINNNDVWDVGEPAIRDVNSNGVYDDGDVVLAWIGPPLSLPGVSLTLNYTWDTTGVKFQPPGKDPKGKILYYNTTLCDVRSNVTVVPYEMISGYEYATDNNERTGCWVNVTRSTPEANFDINPRIAWAGQPVDFDATLTRTTTGTTITKFEWDFGDGTIATYVKDVNLTLPHKTTHSYMTAGKYRVNLTVWNNVGFNHTRTLPIPPENLTIYLRNIAVVGVTPNATVAVVGEFVSVDVAVKNEGGQSDPELYVTVYYGDTVNETIQMLGGLENGATKTVSFAWNTTGLSPGVYTIKAVAGNITKQPLPYEVNTTDNTLVDGEVTLFDAPFVNFTFTPSQPYATQPVSFASTSYDPDTVSDALPLGNITKYVWQFGDGATEIHVLGVNLTTTAQHTYADRGTYKVNLTATDNDGFVRSMVKNVTIYVRDLSVFSVEVGPLSVTAGDFVSVNVTVRNEGDLTESFRVSIMYSQEGASDVTIDSQNATALAPGNWTTLSFRWDTKDVSAGAHTVLAFADDTWDFNPDNNVGEGSVVNVSAPTNVFLYVVAGAAVAIVAVLGLVYFLKIRKPKP